MKQFYFLQSNAIKSFPKIIFLIVLFPLWGLGGLFLLCGLGSLSAQISPPFPDNVYNAECYTNVQATQWGIQTSHVSNHIQFSAAQPFVGDIDNDGHNEVVVFAYDSIIIFNHQLVKKISFPLFSTTPMNIADIPIVIADVDNDGIAEIFFWANFGWPTNGILSCYNYNGNTVITKWQILIPGIITPAFLIIADVNADGIPDIMVSDRIFNAQTGELEVILPLAPGQQNGYPSDGYKPIYADIDNDGILEVVGGNNVIKVSITNAHATIGNNAYIWKSITGTNITDGWTSAADIDLDGFIDIVVEKRQNIYIWKPYTGIGSSPSLMATYFFQDSRNMGGSRVSISDLDNDGYPEMVWSGFLQIQACKYDPSTQTLQSLWQQASTDGSTGFTGATIFDFNNDGYPEIIFRDATHLRIMNGQTGLDIFAFPCGSITGGEYPIIVDLKKNGTTEILVMGNPFSSEPQNVSLCSFKSPNNSWAPARSVWNQNGYHVIHINEDLTVPQYQFNPVTTFTNPNTGVVRRPFNHFMQQVAPVNQYGEPFLPMADMVFIEDSSILIRNSCDSIQIKLVVYNRGEAKMKATFEITTYKDSYRGNIIRVDSIRQPVDTNGYATLFITLALNEFSSFLPINNLAFAVNDAGNGIAQNGGQQTECDTTNNILLLPFGDTQYRASTCQAVPYIGYGFNIPSDSVDTAGVFYFRRNFISAQGCDSITELKLTVHPVYHVQFTDFICRNQTYTANGFNISADSIGTSGTFHFQKSLISAYGCDSIVELILTIYPIYYVLHHASVCQNQPYTENGFSLPVDSTLNTGVFRFQQRLPSIHGCDSIIELELTVHPIYQTQFTASTCQKESYVGYGFNLPSDSTATVGVFHFYQNLTSAKGCDSIVNLELTVHPAYITELNAQSCNFYELGDTLYTESGSYIKTLNTITGCDSVIKLYLTVFNEYNTKITALSCQGFTWNGQTYTTSGEYVQRFMSSQGCDSIVYLDLTILPNSSTIFEDTIYISEAYNQYGFTILPQENKGIYTFQQNLKNQWGCDSIVQLILHVRPPIVDHSVDLNFPNAFTPGKEPNSCFSVAHKRNVKDLKIQIYSRWGEMVFQSSDINFKWNGTDLKGVLAPIGSYVYLVEYHLQTDPNIVRQKKGNVNVIR